MWEKWRERELRSGVGGGEEAVAGVEIGKLVQASESRLPPGLPSLTHSGPPLPLPTPLPPESLRAHDVGVVLSPADRGSREVRIPHLVTHAIPSERTGR